MTHERKMTVLKDVIVGLSVALALAGVGIAVAISSWADSRNQMENYYQKSFYDVTENVDNIDVKLSKLLAAQSDEQTMLLCNDIWRQSDAAAGNLAQLPLRHNGITGTTKFVNQVGDYTYSLSKKLAAGGSVTDDDRDQIEKLQGTCQTVAESLEDLSAKIGAGYRITDNLMRGRTGKPGAMDNTFDVMERNSVDYPKIIYDGPFADSTEHRVFEHLKGKEEVSPEAAKEYITEKFNAFGLKDVNYLGEAGGDLITYEFTAKHAGGDFYVQITKRGCLPIMSSSTRRIGERTLGKDEVVKKAEEFAESLGFEHMRGVWYNEFGGTAYINLAPVIDGVTYYTSLVKVKCALDNGEMTGIESMAYLCKYKGATAPKAVLTEATARSMVSPRLNITGKKLALIPKDNNTEALVYEYDCDYKGFNYIIAINASNGAEEEIFRIVDSNQGSMLE